MRWPHPQWGMMQPGQFISLAEETGQIVPLGSWVLGRAAADSALVPGAGGGPRQDQAPRGGPSRSVRQRERVRPSVQRPRLRRGRATGSWTPPVFEPGALVLELTESVLLRRDDRIMADLMELKVIGVRLAIDDFGTGYSS